MSSLLGGGGILILGGLPRGLTRSNEVHYLRWFVPVTMPTGYGGNDGRPSGHGWVYTRPASRSPCCSPYQTEAVVTAVVRKSCLRSAVILKGKFESRSNNYAKSIVNRLIITLPFGSRVTVTNPEKREVCYRSD